jgi:two-component system phosphate regulon sensor histidine kinase PhoR
MLRISRVWKIYLVYTIVLVTGITLAGLILNIQLRKRLESQLKRDVLVYAELIASAMPKNEKVINLDTFCQDYKEKAGVRITIIKENGEVIGESDRKSNKVTNHLDRPEVSGALEKGTAAAIRYSESLGSDMLYVALLLESRKKIIRLAMPMTKVKTIQNEVMGFLAVALYFIPVLAIIISFFFAKRMTSEKYRG